MRSRSFRVVLDTNVLLRGMLSARSPAGQVLRCCEDRDCVVLTSKALIGEYRAVLLDAEIAARFPVLTGRTVELTLRRLRYIGDYIANPKVRFSYPRDPRDEKLIQLAIAGQATHMVSMDEDLLTLPASRSDAGRRFRQRIPHLHVLKPQAFMQIATG